MSTAVSKIPPPMNGATVVVGSTTIAMDGRVLVDFPGNTSGAMPARSLIPEVDRADLDAAQVLLTFAGDNPEQPIIVGLVHDAMMLAEPSPEVDTTASQADKETSPKSLHLKSEQEIVLECGRSCITLRADGKIVIRGREVTSRAAGTQKIRGATVQIN